VSAANDLGSFPQLPQRCFACPQQDNHAFSAPWGKFTSPVASFTLPCAARPACVMLAPGL
jgi:hypothetical protein